MSPAKRSKDQDLIDDLQNYLRAPDSKTVQTNGHAAPASRPTSSAVRPSDGPTDEMVIEKCRAAENGAKFSDLFDRGDVHAHHGGDDSRADLALVSMLAFWTQDGAQLERLVSTSALGRREKWRRRDNYRKGTIHKALSDLRETYSWPSKNSRPLLSSSVVSLRGFTDDDNNEMGGSSLSSPLSHPPIGGMNLMMTTRMTLQILCGSPSRVSRKNANT